MQGLHPCLCSDTPSGLTLHPTTSHLCSFKGRDIARYAFKRLVRRSPKVKVLVKFPRDMERITRITLRERSGGRISNKRVRYRPLGAYSPRAAFLSIFGILHAIFLGFIAKICNSLSFLGIFSSKKNAFFFGQFFTFSGKHTIFSGNACDFQKIT